MRRLPSHLASFQRLLDDAITVELIAEPLYAVDGADDSTIVAAYLEGERFDECGVKRDKVVHEFIRRADLNTGTVGEYARPVPLERVIAPTSPLWTCMERLASFGSMYVLGDRGLHGVVTTADLNKQPARLLMFGVVSMLEMTLLALIRTHYPGESWRKCLTPNRVKKAEQLHKQRKNRNEDINLEDCLQLCDKAGICITTPVIQEAWNPSKSKCRELFKTLRRVRDNLAHSQSPATDGDWHKVLNALREGHSIIGLSIQMLDANR